MVKLNSAFEREGVEAEREETLDEAGKRARAVGFFRGETCNFTPRLSQHADGDFLVRDVLHGWLPEGPLLTPGTRITAFGSCFAANITRHLLRRGFDLSAEREPAIHISRMMEALVNTHALLGQFEWAFGDDPPDHALWHDWDGQEVGRDEATRARTREVFAATEVFIVTLGLSEIWCDEVSGGVFWRAVPTDRFDPHRHRFRVSTVAENKANLESMDALIRAHVPNAKVLFTLSPVPLAATFRPVSAMTANTVSKAILRAALDEFLRDRWEEVNRRLFYFPAYELVNELCPDRFADDGRHPRTPVIEAVMQIFDAFYCTGGPTPEAATAQLNATRLALAQQAARRARDLFGAPASTHQAG